MALEGSERKILHAILHEQGEASAGYVDDSKIAEIALDSGSEIVGAMPRRPASPSS
jgi:hypothetical protein